MSSTAALVALSRKLAKVSFAPLRTDTRFVPVASENACVSTKNLSAARPVRPPTTAELRTSDGTGHPEYGKGGRANWARPPPLSAISGSAAPTLSRPCVAASR
jgi:hypothetical protein